MSKSYILKFIWENEKRWVIFTLIFSAISGLMPLLFLNISKNLINEVSNLIQNTSQNVTLVLILLIFQLLITVSFLALTKWKEVFDRKFEIRLNHSLQYQILKRNSEVPFIYFNNQEFYNRSVKVNFGTGHIVSFVKGWFSLIEAILSVVSLLIFLLSIHWIIVVACVLFSTPYLFFNLKSGKEKFKLVSKQTPLTREIQYYSYLLRERYAAKEIRLFNLAEYFLGKWSAKYLENSTLTIRLLQKQKLTEYGIDTLLALFYCGVSLTMIWLAINGGLSIGEFVAITQAIQGFQSSAKQVYNVIGSQFENLLHIEEFVKFFHNDLIDVTNGTLDFPETTDLTISFKNVSFSYPDNPRLILKNISLDIASGEKIAIVGHNGSGKSTLIMCLCGLLPVTKGSILIGGENIEKIKSDELKKKISVIFQDFVRYSLTVKENILFGDIELTDNNRLIEAARISGVDKFVNRFQEKYDTYLGKTIKDGEDLSGGEWQKIAIARAMLRDSPIIILDEPTAALDPMAEMDIFESFNNITQGKTVIYISHRMASTKFADRIIVMKNGEIVEYGTHEELVKLNGEYQKMYTSQAEWYQEKEMEVV
ncbi:ABC transporter ATP-binding protein [Brevibacillus agri]|uniref:ABC transporter ATP-binding protein n=1 Tax=Brevibacillus agri TaxID=51101 RepID=UPI000470BD6F|nr:ABC transporter ATP-binding protein [Brevibacillus agri]MED4572682.1 ABC transporter ATP-binding protein [Brevibacillus agri]WHX31553.1 ABC transporter ATP-binding protein [Brevibacillus agri]